MSDRQPVFLPKADLDAMLLALAALSLDRPGWHKYLEELAGRIDVVLGVESFNNFRRFNEDRVKHREELLEIAKALTLATDEGDDRAQNTHYVTVGEIRAKGSFLELIARARRAVAAAWLQ